MIYEFGPCLRSSSASIRSLPRPAASLLRNSASRPMKLTGIPSSSPATRLCQASSKPTPEIDVINSMRLGTCPNWITRAGAVKSSAVRPRLPNPNCSMAARTRIAFGAGVHEEIDIGGVTGYPCHDTAKAPTIRYSTPFEFKHSTNSRKSLLSGIGVGSLPDSEKDRDPFPRVHFASRMGIGGVGLFETTQNADHLLHRSHFTAFRAEEIAAAAEARGQNVVTSPRNSRRLSLLWR